jgi:hypothetical protein
VVGLALAAIVLPLPAPTGPLLALTGLGLAAGAAILLTGVTVVGTASRRLAADVDPLGRA